MLCPLRDGLSSRGDVTEVGGGELSEFFRLLLHARLQKVRHERPELRVRREVGHIRAPQRRFACRQVSLLLRGEQPIRNAANGRLGSAQRKQIGRVRAGNCGVGKGVAVSGPETRATANWGESPTIKFLFFPTPRFETLTRSVGSQRRIRERLRHRTWSAHTRVPRVPMLCCDSLSSAPPATSLFRPPPRLLRSDRTEHDEQGRATSV